MDKQLKSEARSLLRASEIISRPSIENYLLGKRIKALIELNHGHNFSSHSFSCPCGMELKEYQASNPKINPTRLPVCPELTRIRIKKNHE